MNSSDRCFKQCGFQKSRNYQTEQQGIFIAFLNMFYDVIIEHPRKRSKITHPFYTVLKIESPLEYVDCKEVIADRMNELLKVDLRLGCSKKTAMRRQEVYRVVEQLHLLMGLLRELNFVLNTKTTTGNKGTIKETVKQIFYDGYTFNKPYIQEKGVLINKDIANRLINNTKSVLVIKKGDSQFMKILMGLPNDGIEVKLEDSETVEL
ncbi:BAG domain-containing protein [Entamoeba marina]